MHASELPNYRSHVSLPRQFLDTSDGPFILDDSVSDMDAGSFMSPPKLDTNAQEASPLQLSPAPQDRPPDPPVIQPSIADNAIIPGTEASIVTSPAAALAEGMTSTSAESDVPSSGTTGSGTVSIVTQYVYASTTASASAEVTSTSIEQSFDSTQIVMMSATTASDQPVMTAATQPAITISQPFAAVSAPQTLEVTTTVVATISGQSTAASTAESPNVDSMVSTSAMSVQLAITSASDPPGASTAFTTAPMTSTQVSSSQSVLLSLTSAGSLSSSLSSSLSLLSSSSLSSSPLTMSTPTSTSTSRPSDNASSVALASNSHSPMFWVGIVFAVIAALACIAAFLAWTIRIRTRSRHDESDHSTSWSWDRRSHNGFGSDDGHLETGFSGIGEHTNEPNWSQREKQTQSTIPQTSEYDPDMITTQESNVLTDSCFLPRPPAATYMQHRLVGPYPTIHINEGRQSVPDLAPNLGSLQVTNLMPGDVSSLGLTSRDESSFAPQHDGTNYYLDGGGSHFSPANDGAFRQVLPTPHHVLLDSPHGRQLPNASDFQNPEGHFESEGWAASLRNNLFNAFSAVVGSNNHPDDPFGDKFTRPPLRRERSRRGSTTTSVSNDKHEKTVSSLFPPRNGSILEDIEEGIDGSGSRTRDRAVILPRPPAAILSHERIESSLNRADRMSRTNSEQSEASTAQLGYLASTPGMPEHSLSADAYDGHIMSEDELHTQTRSQDAVYEDRRAEVTTPQSSPALSMISDLSRETSERLSAQEALAKKFLKQRRTRILETDPGSRTRSSGSRLPKSSMPAWQRATAYGNNQDADTDSNPFNF